MLLQSYTGIEIKERYISMTVVVKLLGKLFSEIWSNAVLWKTLFAIGFPLSEE